MLVSIDFLGINIFVFLCLHRAWLLTVALWASEFYNKSTFHLGFKV